MGEQTDQGDNGLYQVFPWDANFETGIAVIDEQHQRLVQMLNDLAAAIAQQEEAVELQHVFDQLSDYADYHFKTEENYWSPHLKNDPWFVDHRKTHDSTGVPTFNRINSIGY